MSDGKSNVVALRAEAAPFLRVVEHGPLPLSQRSDETLMLEHGHGSEDSYAELVRRHQKGVLNFIFRMVHNRHIAEELTQEVFMALVKNAQRYEPTAKFTTYLYAIASLRAASLPRHALRGNRRDSRCPRGHGQEPGGACRARITPAVGAFSRVPLASPPTRLAKSNLFL